MLELKKKHLFCNIMKFERSKIYFYEIIKVSIFLAQQITTKMFLETWAWDTNLLKWDYKT